jgi:hypothetical protein
MGNAEQCSRMFQMDENATINLPQYTHHTAICTECTECAESHLCLAPYTCVCPTDWSGNDCTELPQNVTLTATGSDSLEFRWEPPQHNIHRQNKLSKTSTPDLTNTKEESDYVPAAVLSSSEIGSEKTTLITHAVLLLAAVLRRTT